MVKVSCGVGHSSLQRFGNNYDRKSFTGQASGGLCYEAFLAVSDPLEKG
jgi:hypothetical protein